MKIACLNEFTSGIFVECTKILCNKRYAYVLCIISSLKTWGDNWELQENLIIIINTTHEISQFINGVKRKIPRCVSIYPKAESKHDVCYQCYKDGTDLSFRKIGVREKKYKPFLPVNINKILINTL